MECAWSITFFSIHKYNAGGNDYWRQEEMLLFFFFNVFDERENEAGSCRVINGRWTQRSSLTFSLTFLSSDVPKQSQPHPLSPFGALCFTVLANLADIHLECLWSFNGKASNFVWRGFGVARLCSGFVFSLELSNFRLRGGLGCTYASLRNLFLKKGRVKGRYFLNKCGVPVFKGVLRFRLRIKICLQSSGVLLTS